MTQPIAIFHSQSTATLHSGSPTIVGPVGNAFTITGLTNGIEHFVGLALDLGGGQFVPAGPVLSSTPGAPIYVDAASTAESPDGTTPATAFPNPLSGALIALSMGGGNVWIAGGEYTAVSLPVASGVAIHGGFGADFDPTTSRTDSTVLHGHANLAIADVGGGGTSVLDGLILEGDGVSGFGVDVDETSIQVRSCTVQNCSGRGIRLRSLSTTQAHSARIVRSTVTGNSADGVSGNGPWNLRLFGSRFDGNGQEGVDFNDLIAPNGVSVILTARACTFFGNVAQGMDVDLVAPPFGGPSGAVFNIMIENCDFVANGEEGLLIDSDFDLIANWSSDVVLQGVTARNNRKAGILIDADAEGRTFLHRVLASANGGDGLTISSESTPGVAVVQASVFVGNQGSGVRATFGNVAILGSHLAIMGNSQAGMASEVVESSAVSSLIWNQLNPFIGTRNHANTVVTGPSPFVDVPSDYLNATSLVGAGIGLTSFGDLQVGDTVEVGDDGVERTVQGFLVGGVTLTPTPAGVLFPTTLFLHSAGNGVLEDYAATPTGPGANAGLAAPGMPSVDAGVSGAAISGRPGQDDVPTPNLFRLATLSHAPGQPLGGSELLQFQFAGGDLDPSSVDADSVRVVSGNGAELVVGLAVVQGRLQLSPPTGGWGTEAFVVELHSTLRSMAGDPMASTVAVPLAP